MQERLSHESEFLIVLFGATGYLGADIFSSVTKLGGQAVTADYKQNAPNKSREKTELVVYAAGPNQDNSRDSAEIDRYLGDLKRAFYLAHESGSPLVFISTIHVYGSNLVGIIDESSPTYGSTPYAEVRLRAEEMLIALADSYGESSIVILRVSNGFGLRPGMTKRSLALVGNQVLISSFHPSKPNFSDSHSSSRVFSSLFEITGEVLTIKSNSPPKGVTTRNVGLGDSLTPRELFMQVQNLIRGESSNFFDESCKFRFASKFSAIDSTSKIHSLEKEIRTSREVFKARDFVITSYLYDA